MDDDLLSAAVFATFTRRGTVIPGRLPDGLTSRFANDQGKQTQWQAFLKKNSLQAPSLFNVVAELATFSRTPLARAAAMRSGD